MYDKKKNRQENQASDDLWYFKVTFYISGSFSVYNLEFME